VEKLEEEYNRREVVLKWMVKNNMSSYEDVAQVIRNYYFNPDDVYSAARLGAKI
jgi:flagellar protein FlaI